MKSEENEPANRGDDDGIINIHDEAPNTLDRSLNM